MAKLCSIRIRTLIFCILCGLSVGTHAYKILGLFPHSSESHFVVVKAIMTELAKREHNVTIYSSHRIDEQIENLNEIIVEPQFPFWSELQKSVGVSDDMNKLKKIDATSLQYSMATVGAAATDYFLSNTKLQELLHHQFDYDLIIVDLFYSESLLTLGYVHNTPTIGIVSTNFENYMQNIVENIVPVACSQIDFESNNAENSGYWERLTKIRNCMSRRQKFIDYNKAEQEKLIAKHFSNTYTEEVETLTTSKLYAQLGLLLVNNHVPLTMPRPLLQNIIDVGGLQIRPPRELPWHIRRFLDEARVGAIYLNLGNERGCDRMSKRILKSLIPILSKRTERVLLNCNDMEEFKELSKNVVVQHMVPQTDILAHPHIKIFITSGDLISLQDGIIRHVPIIGIPIFQHEIANINLAERLGVGIKLDYENLTDSSLAWALQTLSYDSAYTVTIRQVSAEFRDRPLGALETSIFWINYILRRNGGKQIRTPGIGINLRQLHLFDLFIFYFVSVIVFVGTIAALSILAVRILRREQLKKMYSKLS